MTKQDGLTPEQGTQKAENARLRLENKKLQSDVDMLTSQYNVVTNERDHIAVLHEQASELNAELTTEKHQLTQTVQLLQRENQQALQLYARTVLTLHTFRQMLEVTLPTFPQLEVK